MRKNLWKLILGGVVAFSFAILILVRPFPTSVPKIPAEAPTENLCGPLALVEVCRLYAIDTDVQELANLSELDTRGTSMAGLFEASKRKGLKPIALNITLDELAEKKSPAILHVHIGPRIIDPRELYFDDLVPEFCLYGNGDLIYRDKRSFAAGKWKFVKLNEAEMDVMLDQVLRSGITSYDPANITFTKLFGVSDRSTTVIGVCLRHLVSDIKYVQEISIYGLGYLADNFPGVEIFGKQLRLAEFLEKYQSTEAVDYRPEIAELSVVEMAPVPIRSDDDTRTYLDSVPRWSVCEVELDRAEKHGWHNVLELRGQEIENVLKLLDLEDQPKMYRYRDRLYKIQFRPIFPHFPRDRIYLPFPESVPWENNSEVPHLE